MDTFAASPLFASVPSDVSSGSLSPSGITFDAATDSATDAATDSAGTLPVPTPSSPDTSLRLQSPAGSSRLARWNDSAWRLDAACAHMDTLIFFPIGETGPVAQQVSLAKSICASCPVREQCLEFAIATIQNDGIWGGTTEDERRLIKRARRAAARRAAKTAA
jgi:WhiB family transcriptional regulator, redox-sensing transcriptional regulator